MLLESLLMYDGSRDWYELTCTGMNYEKLFQSLCRDYILWQEKSHLTSKLQDFDHLGSLELLE